jgi:tetratricopeptide (TPR) repeat protein
MIAVALLCSGLMSAMPVFDDPARAEAAKPIADMAAYEEASARAGRDADAHVRLALWCEAHGLTAQRIKHLARAVLSDPGNVTARSLMGLVSFEGKWVRPEKVADALKADPARTAVIDDYLQRRAKAVDTADAQYKLALWCEENGLSEQAVAHLRRVVQLDPKREKAWKRLGYKKQANGRWMTASQLAEAKAEADAQKAADRIWRPRLEKLRADLEGKKPKTRQEAQAALEGISAPRAVPSIWLVFAQGNGARQAVAVQLLGQIDTPASTQSLALLAISAESADARHKSIEILRRRDPRDYATLLAGLMRKEIKYTFTPVRGPGQSGTLIVEGERFNTARRYTPPELPDLSQLLRNGRNMVWTTDANGLPALVNINARMGNGFNQGYIGPDGSAVAVGPWAMAMAPTIRAQNAAAQALMGEVARHPDQAASILAGNKNKALQPGVTRGPLGNVTLSTNPAIGAAMQAASLPTLPGTSNQFDIGRAMVETEQAARAAEQQLENDVRSLELHNKATRDQNRKVVDAINGASGQSLPPDPETCQRWAVDQLGMAFRSTPDTPKPTVIEDVPLDYQLPRVTGFATDGLGYTSNTLGRWSHSCFGKGTTVHTQQGLLPIEAIRAGDLVLSQDLKTGALAFQPVVTVYHNPPNATLKVSFSDSESIVATGIHRFWKAGQGWVMARELKTGDVIRTIGGTAEVVSVKDDATQPVFNLEVASGQSFFVGEAGMLVHDNSLVSPEPKPFDASTDLTALKAKE